MLKISWFYEKVHNIANYWGYAAILLRHSTACSDFSFWSSTYS